MVGGRKVLYTLSVAKHDSERSVRCLATVDNRVKACWMPREIVGESKRNTGAWKAERGKRDFGGVVANQRALLRF